MSYCDASNSTSANNSETQPRSLRRRIATFSRPQTPDVDDDEVADDMPPSDEPSPEEALEHAIAEETDAEDAAE